MESSSSPIDSHAAALAAAVDRALPEWVIDAVRSRAEPAGKWDDTVAAAARRAARAAAADVVPRLRALLDVDIDVQTTTPLSVLRSATGYATEVLRSAGVAPGGRDDDQRRRFPDDDYDLTPATFADFGADVGDAGIAWGAAKAFAHRQRHGGPR